MAELCVKEASASGLWYNMVTSGMVGRVQPGRDEVKCRIEAPCDSSCTDPAECGSKSMGWAAALGNGG